MKNSNRINLITWSMLFFMTGILGSRPLIPLLSNQLGANTFEIGFIIALFALFPLVFAVKIGHIIDRVGTLVPLLISAIAGIISLLFPFFYG